MKLMLQRAGRYDAYIRRSRLEICNLIGLDPVGEAVEPLPHAFYLFGFDDSPDPVAMAEFFFYDEDDFRTAFYRNSPELRDAAPLDALIHTRSLFVNSGHRHSIGFVYLVAGLVEVAHRLGARYMTAATAADNAYLTGLHATAGMRKIAVYPMDGTMQQLSFTELTSMAERARTLRRYTPVAIPPDVVDYRERFARSA